jgi:hypothetical protein
MKSSHALSGTVALHSIPKRSSLILPSTSSASRISDKKTSARPTGRKRLHGLRSTRNSSDDDDCLVSGAVEELFSGACWLSGDAAPSSTDHPHTSAAAAADPEAVAAICSDDDTSGDGDVVLDGGLRVY